MNNLELFTNYTLFETKKISITVMSLIEIAFVILITISILFLVKKTLNRSRKFDSGKKYSINNLLRYVLWILAFSIILNILGTDLKFILAGSAALLVGVGLGLQNLFSDFVSGIIILIDSSIKVGDIIEVNELVCKVDEINFRTTHVLTRSDTYILLPNTFLTKNEIINWTHANNSTRFDVSVGVDYSSDIDLVMKLMKEVCINHNEVLNTPTPIVRFNNFGDSSLDFTVYFWAYNLFRIENVKSDIRVAIFKSFAENNISIPFPQRVLHYPDNTSTQTQNIHEPYN